MTNYQVKVEICTKACIIAGQAPIDNLFSGRDATTIVCRECIDKVIAQSLEGSNFEYTKKTARLLKSPGDVGYILPVHYARLYGLTERCGACSILDNIAINTNVYFKILNDKLYIEAEDLACDCGGEVELVYMSADIGGANLSASLLDAMAHLLAYYILLSNKGMKVADMAYRKYLELIGDARSVQKAIHRPSGSLAEPYMGFRGGGRGRLR